MNAATVTGSLQSCLTFCYPMDCNLPGSSGHGISQARIPEWVAISFSRGSFWLGDRTQVSCMAGKLFTIWSHALIDHDYRSLRTLCCSISVESYCLHKHWVDVTKIWTVRCHVKNRKCDNEVMATFKKNALPCVTSLDQPVSTLKDVLMCKKKKLRKIKVLHLSHPLQD